jgi:hypothetical protein
MSEVRKLVPYDPEDHPYEELVAIDPSVVLAEGGKLMPGVEVYIRTPKPGSGTQRPQPRA